MNLNDQITALLNNNVATVTIGMSPERQIWISVDQLVETGPKGNQVISKHQATTNSVTECVNQIQRSIEHLSQLQTSVIRLKK